jgi:hypothetical protein
MTPTAPAVAPPRRDAPHDDDQLGPHPLALRDVLLQRLLLVVLVGNHHL